MIWVDQAYKISEVISESNKRNGKTVVCGVAT